uniref:uncharacterized protein LOC108949502 isoform X2 n=1 Tax=Ciona intestinalis TaxID=7719 RepID=UPI000EF55910|nr:uncharacterized protein LOC108949502 isoform X2 [Ciona intestinalis]|eukprot:XP_026690521.1 uncharacterized protein LOC108949502 isoform X2 [Ciona intestinalis]
MCLMMSCLRPELMYVQELWKMAPHDLLVSTILNGNVRLFHRSFCTLQSTKWLDDSVMNFSLKMMSQNKNILVLDSFLVGCILTEKERVLKRHLMKSVTFSNFDVIMGAVNVNQSHWNLLYIHLKSMTIAVIDPFGHTCCDVTSKFRNYLKMRNCESDKNLTETQWRNVTVVHPTQTDSHSCGIFVIKIAEALLTSRTKMKKNVWFDASNILQTRMEIAQQILNVSDNLEEVCNICGKCNESSLWIGCDSCHRWFHCNCLNIKKKEYNHISAQNTIWLCPVCKEK